VNAYVKAYWISLIVAFIYISSAPPAFSTPGKSSTTLGSTWGIDQNEKNNDTLITNIIASYSTAAGYSTYNWYGADATTSNIYAAADGVGYPYSVSFYIGHGNDNLNLYGTTYGWLIINNSGGCVYDDPIFDYSVSDQNLTGPYTYTSNDKFVFLWSCEQGDVVGGYDPSYGYWWMPYAWLHTTSLSGHGYEYSDSTGLAFLGFNGGAPFLGLTLGGVKNASFSFLKYFYYYTLVRGHDNSIRDALNKSALAVWGISFPNCVLYTGVTYPDGSSGNMVVYGDGKMHISNASADYFTVSSAYDSPTPMSGWFNDGTNITESVTSPVAGATGTQYVCTGWTGTGSVPSSGTTTSVTFTINASSSITWNWKTQYYFTVSSPYDSPNPKSGWFDSGTSITEYVTHTVVRGHGGYYTCWGWEGTGSVPASGVGTSVTFTITQPSRITWLWALNA
jgi:hypothetical protein